MPAATGRAISKTRHGPEALRCCSVAVRVSTDDQFRCSNAGAGQYRCMRNGRENGTALKTSPSVLASIQVWPNLSLLASQAPHPAVAGSAHFAEFGGALSGCGIVEDDR